MVSMGWLLVLTFFLRADAGCLGAAEGRLEADEAVVGAVFLFLDGVIRCVYTGAGLIDSWSVLVNVQGSAMSVG